MNVDTIIENLERTIAGKEALLASSKAVVKAFDDMDDQCDAWLKATLVAQYLEINLEELRKILADVKDLKAHS